MYLHVGKKYDFFSIFLYTRDDNILIPSVDSNKIN